MRGPDVPSQSPRTLKILAAKMGPAEIDVIVASAYATSWASTRRASANQPIRFRHDFARLRDDLTRHDDQLVHFGFRVSDPTPLHIDAVLRRIPVVAIEETNSASGGRNWANSSQKCRKEDIRHGLLSEPARTARVPPPFPIRYCRLSLTATAARDSS